MPSTHSIVMVALPPITMKINNVSEMPLKKQRQRNWEELNAAHWQVLHPATLLQNPSAESRYCNVLCANGNVRSCKPTLAAFLADCPEYRNLLHLERHVCFWCECPKNTVGDYVPPDNNTPSRITTYIECLARSIPRQQMPNSSCAMCPLVSTCFNRFTVLWVLSLSLTSSIKDRLECWTTSRSWFSTAWRCMNGSTITLQSHYPSLLTTT